MGPAFYVRQGMSARADVSPPSRIIDFKMTGTIDDSLYIQLEWSAPGDDYDRGRGKYLFILRILSNLSYSYVFYVI